ncbi:MAG: fatty acid desaturase [Gammaproteobacteria bacterium]|nr:fatty acid desaturase [Gammaproteobacteria bacterium]
MPDKFTATNAASSGIELERKTLKELCRRSDRPGLVYLAQWALALLASGCGVYLALGTAWVWPAMLIHGAILSVPAYAMSHETAHGTAFRTRWLNELVLWITSLIYFEEPLHRRYTHTNHHTYTWHVGKDSQMPFDTPMTFGAWLAEVSGFALLHFHLTTLLRLASGRYTQVMREVVAADEFPRLRRNALIFIAVYAGIALAITLGASFPWWFLVLPWLLGRPVMLLFTLIQHVEMAENAPSILDSTRSFQSSPIASFLYLNMENHVEHHLYPQVPFYALPELHRAIKDQLPATDPGFWRTNLEVLSVVLRRSLGRNTRARSIRQAAHMITDGGFQKLSLRSMK